MSFLQKGIVCILPTWSKILTIGINLLEAIEMFSEVLDSCKSQSISNCFAHTRVFPQKQEALLPNICLDSDKWDLDLTKELATILSNLQIAENPSQ
ncbi:hypothetical protein HK096_001423 [Nowakowskiella sp. JEL0078]|nr:hypothetical protein HK096_001423 [Nowakowskiella sp. JEL0078]